MRRAGSRATLLEVGRRHPRFERVHGRKCSRRKEFRSAIEVGAVTSASLGASAALDAVGSSSTTAAFARAFESRAAREALEVDFGELGKRRAAVEATDRRERVAIYSSPTGCA